MKKWLWLCAESVFTFSTNEGEDEREVAICKRVELAGGTKEDNEAWFDRNDQLIEITNAESLD